MTPRYDAIILGAGLAGIAAAERLTAANLNVALIEARTRFGGRVWTRHDPTIDYPIEMGPEWFDQHGEMHRLLADESQLATGSFLRRVGGVFQKMEEPDDAWLELHRRLEAVQGDDRSLASALAECCDHARFADAAEALRQYVSGFHAADPNQLSLAWLRVAEQNQTAGDAEVRSRQGLDGAVNTMLSQIGRSCTVYLDTRATAVRWREGSVEVDAESNGRRGTLTANSAVCTLPLSLMQRGSVKFSPALTEKESALDFLATGPVIKLICVFDAPFWRGLPQLGDALFFQDRAQPIPTWWTPAPIDAPVLVGWVAGPLVVRVHNLEPQDLLKTAMHSLAQALGLPGRRVAKRLKCWYWHNWQRDPYSLGAYSWVKAGGIDAHKALAAPLGRALFFAGEATQGDGLNATMDGAIESGQRAAAELLAI